MITGEGYRMRPVNALGSDPWVDFAVVEPVDTDEAMLRIYVSRAAWESQGSPGEVHVSLTMPTPAPAPAPAQEPPG